MFENPPILIQIPFASPNWLLKMLPWINIGNSVYKVSSINFEKKHHNNDLLFQRTLTS